MKDFVPKAVRDLLRYRWRESAVPDPGLEWLTTRWFIREGDEHPSLTGGWGPPLSLPELKALLSCGAIPERFAYIDRSGGGQLNDYAARSIQTCLRECCEAYNNHVLRMKRHARGFDLRSSDDERRRKAAQTRGECST